MMDILMQDNNVQDLSDVISQVIEEAVQNALENSEGLDLRSRAGIECVAWMIVDYLEVITAYKVDLQSVISELERQK